MVSQKNMADAPTTHAVGTRSRRGFTLVELLVVIGIIALLISILLPSLNKARRAANTVACASNMRQIGIAFQMYMNANNNCLPPSSIRLPNNPPISYTGWAITWDDLLAPYLGKKMTDVEYGAWPRSPYDVPVMHCPEDNSIRANIGLGNNAVRKSYGINWNPDYSTPWPYKVRGIAMPVLQAVAGNFVFPTPPTFHYIKPSEYKAATQTILLAEMPHDANVIGWGDGRTGNEADSPAGQLLQVKTALHNKTFNYLMCDGHVEPLNPFETFGTGTWNNPLGMWSRAVD
jgi:prepilin-type N-terminal cleavage/methylation domain-containing protein/prepilin-type processing-associated H-X9-DG protein